YNNPNWIFGSITWTGASDTSFATAGNWDSGVTLGQYDKAVIANAARQPVLAGATQLLSLTIQSGSTLNLNGQSISVSSATDNSGTIELQGGESIAFTGGITTNNPTSTVIYHGTHNDTADTYNLKSWFYNHLIISGAEDGTSKDTFRQLVDFSVGGNLTVESAILDTQNHNLSVTGATGIAGTLNPGSANLTFSSLALSGSIGSGTGIITDNGDFSMTSGTYNGGSGKNTFGGNLTISSGTFNATSGTLEVTGTGKTLNTAGGSYSHNGGVFEIKGTGIFNLRGTNTFNRLACFSGGKTINFDAAGIQTVGSLVLQGASGNPIKIVSSLDNNAARIIVSTGTAECVLVKDSNNTGTQIYPTVSSNLGNNSGWIFSNSVVSWNGSVSSAWNAGGNWNLGSVPTEYDNVTVPLTARQPVFAGNTRISSLTIEVGATLHANGKTLEATSGFVTAGTLEISGSIIDAGITQPSILPGATIKYSGGSGTLYNWPYQCLKLTGPGSSYTAPAAPLNVAGGLVVETDTTLETRAGQTVTITGETIISGTLRENGTDLRFNGDFNSSGCFLGSSGRHYFSGSWTNTGVYTATAGTTEVVGAGESWNQQNIYHHNQGAVILTGSAGNSTSFTGSTAFHSFNCDVPGRIIRFDAADSKLQSFDSLTLTGAVGSLISLFSTIEGDSAEISVAAAAVSYVFVKDSMNTGDLIVPVHSSLLGDSSGWDFSGIVSSWTGASDTDWANPGNWCDGFVPSSFDNAALSALARPVLSASASVSSLSIAAGATLRTGDHAFTVSSGKASFIDNGTLEVSAGQSVTEPTLNPGAEVRYTGGSGNLNHWGYRKLELCSAGPFQLSADLRVAETFEIASGTLSTGLFNLEVSGDFSNAGSFSGGACSHLFYGNWTNSGTYTAAASTVFTGEVTAANCGTFSHNSGTVEAAGAGNFTLNGSFDFNNFVCTVPAKTLLFQAGCTYGMAGALKIVGGNANLIRLRSSSLGVSFSINDCGTEEISYSDVSDCSAVNGITAHHSRDSGHNSNWTFSISTLTWNGTASDGWFEPSNWDLGYLPNMTDRVVIQPAANQPKLTAEVEIDSLEIQAGASLILNGNSLEVTEGFHNNGTLELNGDEGSVHFATGNDADSGKTRFVKDTGTITIKDLANYHHLVFASAGDAEFRLPADIVVNSTLEVQSGLLNQNGRQITLAAGGTVENDSSFIAMSGNLNCLGNASFLGACDISFHDLTAATAGSSLIFQAGRTYNIGGGLRITGTAGHLIRILSTSPGGRFYLGDSGTEEINFVDLRDCTAVNGITAYTSKDSGNNSGWTFVSTGLTWNGALGTDWGTGGNWSFGYVPNVNDKVEIPAAANDPVLSSNTTVSSLTIETGAVLSLGGKNFTVSGAFENQGTLQAFGTESVTLDNDFNSGLVKFIGTGGNIVIPGLRNYYNLEFSSLGNATFELPVGITVENRLTLTSGAFSPHGADLILEPNAAITNNACFVTPASGSVICRGSATFNGTAGIGFYSLSCLTPGSQLNFLSGKTYGLNGTLSIAGSADSLVKLRSSVPGSRFTFQDNGSEEVSLADVADCAAVNGIIAESSLDSGNNQNWIFKYFRAWNRLTLNPGFSPRSQSACAVFNDRVWLIGGSSASDVWSSGDGSAWTCEVAGAPFGPRTGHVCLAFDNQLFVIGGEGCSDVWASEDGRNWVQKCRNLPSGVIKDHAAVVFNNKLWLIGGDGNGSRVYCSADGKNWETAVVSGQFDSHKKHSCAVYKNKIWLYGGDANQDLWNSADGCLWTMQMNNGLPRRTEIRGGHAGIAFDDLLWVIGGNDIYGNPKNDFWHSSDGISWIEETASGFSPRTELCCVAFQGRILAIAGHTDQDIDTSEVWQSPSLFKDTLRFPVNTVLSTTEVTLSESQSLSLQQTAEIYFSDGSHLSGDLSWSLEHGSGDLNGFIYSAPGSCATAELSAAYTYQTETFRRSLAVYTRVKVPASFSLKTTEITLCTNQSCLLEPTTEVIFIDGSRSVCSLNWSIKSGYGTIGSGSYFAPGIPGNAELTAGYTFNSVTAARTLTVHILSQGSDWISAREDPGFSPRIRAAGSAFNNKLWVVGGSSTSDVWSSADGWSWTCETSSAQFGVRNGHTCLVFNGRLWVIGGSGFKDVWSSVDGRTWNLSTSNMLSGNVGYHSSVVFNGKMWIIGGENNDSRVWYSSEGVLWNSATITAQFGHRVGHASVVFNNRIWVIGGDGCADVWSSADGIYWTQAVLSAPFGVRTGHSCVVYNDRIWLIGGGPDSSTPLNDIWYSTDGANWVKYQENAGFSPRTGQTAIAFGGYIWVIGGGDTGSTGARSDVWYFKTAAEQGASSNQIPLKSGWNLISLGLTPQQGSIEVIFRDLTRLRYVMGFMRNPTDLQNEGFKTYMNIDNLRQFSTLLTMDGYHGYWIYMTGDETLEVSGVPIQTDSRINLFAGWNLAGYWIDKKPLPQQLSQTYTVIDSIFNAPLVNGASARYIMGFYRTTVDGPEGFRTFMNTGSIGFSTLNSLTPCQGYWIFMIGNGTLDYSYRIQN
ncbi:MAG: hypothetical protein PHW04_13415, partial [Candidatus Wallbacteria bacterium]|nr:hypothetical protein [Candidatus Wallbacteria bacterium]